jgi:hypothetical protein
MTQCIDLSRRARPLFRTILSPALQTPHLDRKQNEGTKVQGKTLKVGLQKVYAYIYSALLKFFPEHCKQLGCSHVKLHAGIGPFAQYEGTIIYSDGLYSIERDNNRVFCDSAYNLTFCYFQVLQKITENKREFWLCNTKGNNL